MTYLAQQTNRPRNRYTSQGVVIPDSMIDESFRGVYDGSNNLIYKGFARPGADTGIEVWQISKLSYDGSDNVLTIKWPQQIAGSTVISTETVGTVTNPWTAFSGTLAFFPIIVGSLTLTVGALTFTETSYGVLSGGGLNTGTINYATGAITLVINPALGGDTDVIADYDAAILGTSSNDYLFVWDFRTSYIYV